MRGAYIATHATCDTLLHSTIDGAMRRDVPRSLPYASPIDGGDAEDWVRFGDGDGDGDGDDGCLSDSQYVEEEVRIEKNAAYVRSLLCTVSP